MTLHMDSFLDEDETDCGCQDKDDKCPVAQAILGRAIGDLDPTVTLYYRDRDDWLSEDQLDAIFNTSTLESVEEQVNDWFYENRHFAVEYEIKELIDVDCEVMLIKHSMLDRLEEEIHDRDDSDPFGELARAVPSAWLSHPTHVEVEEGADPTEEIKRICKQLGIDYSMANDMALRYLVVDLDACGELEIAWECDLPEIFKQFYWEIPEQQDDLLLRIDNVSVGIDGYWVVVHGLVTVPLRVGAVRYVRNGDAPKNERAQHVEVISEFDAYKQQLERFFDYRQQLLEGTSNGAS